MHIDQPAVNLRLTQIHSVCIILGMKDEDWASGKKAWRIQASLPEDIYSKICQLALRDRTTLAQQLLWACVAWVERDGRVR